MPTLVPDQIITGTNVQQRMMVNFLVVLLDVKLAKNKEKGKTVSLLHLIFVLSLLYVILRFIQFCISLA